MNKIEIDSRNDLVRDSHSKAIIFAKNPRNVLDRNKKDKIRDLEKRVLRLEEMIARLINRIEV